MAAAAGSGASASASPELMIGVEKVEVARSGGLYREEIGGGERLDADKAAHLLVTAATSSSRCLGSISISTGFP